MQPCTLMTHDLEYLPKEDRMLVGKVSCRRQVFTLA